MGVVEAHIELLRIDSQNKLNFLLWENVNSPLCFDNIENNIVKRLHDEEYVALVNKTIFKQLHIKAVES